NVGYISTDGHHFSCENPATNVGDFHIVFVVDKSGSMSYSDCKPLGQKTQTSRLLYNHQNRLGAVYEAVYTFIETRKNSRKATRVGLSAIDRDITSLILFDDAATVVFENQSLSNTEQLLSKMMKFNANGGTSFHAGINKAAEIVEKYHDRQKTNVIIFLSNGECSVPESGLRSLCQREVKKGAPLYLYTVMFGSYENQSLQQMADIETEYLPRSTSKDVLRCQYLFGLNEIKLIEHFAQVSESLRKHQPMLIRK
ncbi:3585_t:CDS:2, partial [Ambispora gerdemannii]